MTNYYELNPSQEVVKLQCKYTLFKRVINIISAMEFDTAFDLEIMKKAFNEVVKRNDCLRLRFKKVNKELKQYFVESDNFDTIPYKEFKTEKEQKAFFDKLAKRAIKYKKGVVVEPYFIKTFDGKYLVLIKVCHLILDIYGIHIIFDDLFNVYTALKEGKELPPEPTKFEDVIKKDLETKHSEIRAKKNKEFFDNYFVGKDEPYYAGLHGKESELWRKQLDKGKRSAKMYFLRNDTTGYVHRIDKDTIDKVVEYSKQSKISIANILFYLSCLCASRMNGNVRNMLPLELCNCRATNTEKKCAGTKVQSLGCYTVLDYDKPFSENLTEFVNSQNQLYRHIDFSDQEFEMLVHKTYVSSMLETYYPLTFSLIPYRQAEGYNFKIYSNGKGALIAYLALLYDIDKGVIDMAYDVQDKMISEDDVLRYHKNYIAVINQAMDNPSIALGDVKIDIKE